VAGSIGAAINFVSNLFIASKCMFAQRIFPAGIATNWPHKLSINPRLARKFDGEGLVLIDTKGKNFPCYDLVRWITSTQKKI